MRLLQSLCKTPRSTWQINPSSATPIEKDNGHGGSQMNIYELEKQATPGPYIAVAHEVMAELNGKCRTLAFCYDDDPSGTTLDTEADTTAKLLTHCRNHFMRALKELKMCLLASFCPFCGRDNSLGKNGCTRTDCPGVKLVKELEEVK